MLCSVVYSRAVPPTLSALFGVDSRNDLIELPFRSSKDVDVACAYEVPAEEPASHVGEPRESFDAAGLTHASEGSEG